MAIGSTCLGVHGFLKICQERKTENFVLQVEQNRHLRRCTGRALKAAQASTPPPTPPLSRGAGVLGCARPLRTARSAWGGLSPACARRSFLALLMGILIITKHQGHPPFGLRQEECGLTRVEVPPEPQSCVPGQPGEFGPTTVPTAKGCLSARNSQIELGGVPSWVVSPRHPPPPRPAGRPALPRPLLLPLWFHGISGRCRAAMYSKCLVTGNNATLLCICPWLRAGCDLLSPEERVRGARGFGCRRITPPFLPGAAGEKWHNRKASPEGPSRAASSP